MAKNNVWQWDETAANNSDIAGIDVSGATGKVKDGDNVMRTIMSQIITMEGKGADVASAGTLTLGTERYYHVTGTTTITDIDFTDAVDGRWAWLIFDGALTLTHNSTTLKLPGGANITTAAGDRALFVQDSSDNVICLSYVPAAGLPSAYAEGTFTPAMTFGGSATGVTFDSQFGRYTRIGNIVHFRIFLDLSNNGSGTGAAVVTGLPFTAAGGVGGGGIFTNWSNLSGVVGTPGGLVDTGATTISLNMSGATASVAMTDTNITNTATFTLVGWYAI